MKKPSLGVSADVFRPIHALIAGAAGGALFAGAADAQMIFRWNAGNDWYGNGVCSVMPSAAWSNWTSTCGSVVFPTSTDDVIIPAGGPGTAVTMVTPNGSHLCRSITTAAGTSLECTNGPRLFIEAPSTIAGDLTLRGVIISDNAGPLTNLSLMGNVLIAKLGLNDATVVFDRLAIAQSGPVTWTGSNIVTSIGTTWTNTNTFEITGNNQWSVPIFFNQGTFTKHTGTGTTDFSLGSFSNAGIVNANSGRLLLGGTGASVSTGAFNAAPGAVIEYYTHTFAQPASLTGDGWHRFSFGTHTINGSLPASNVEYDGVIGGGTTRAGTGDLQVSGELRWTRAIALGAGSTTIQPGGLLTLQGGQPSFVFIQGGHRVSIAPTGLCHWTSGDVGLNMGSQLVNSGTVLISCDRSITCAGAPSRFHNMGEVIKTSSGTTTLACVQFDNDGTVALPVFAGPGTRQLVLTQSSDGHSTGEWIVQQGSRLAFRPESNRTFHFDSAPSPNGPFRISTGPGGVPSGWVEFGGGTVSLNTFTAIDNLDFLGGQIIGIGDLAVIREMNWRSGSLNGSGTLYLLPPSRCTIDQPVSVTGRRISNEGNLPGRGLIQVGNSTVTLNTGASVDNHGLWEIRGDGDLFAGALPIPQFRNRDAGFGVGRGVIRKSSGTGVSTWGVEVVNSGDIVVESGTIDPGSSFVQTTGTITLHSGGTFGSQGRNLDIGAGRLEGTGTVVANGAFGLVNNAGTVATGGAGSGPLTVTGRYSQGAGGTFEMGVSRLDTLAVSGPVELNGTLRLLLAPPPNNVVHRYDILTAPSITGTFNVVEEPGRPGFIVDYAPTRIRVCWNVGDVDDGSLTGTRDHMLTEDDILYYVFYLYGKDNPLADIVDDNLEYYKPDGGLTIMDLLYFLALHDPEFECGS